MVLLEHKLNVKLSQRQILTPGLVQMVSVLALNKLELQDMINTEMVENPVLEELEDAIPLLDDVGRQDEERDRIAAQATSEEKPQTAVEAQAIGIEAAELLATELPLPTSFESVQSDLEGGENFSGVLPELAAQADAPAASPQEQKKVKDTVVPANHVPIPANFSSAD